MEKSKLIKNKYFLSALGILIISGGYFWYSRSKSSFGEVKYITEKAQKGPIVSSISASGSVTVDSEATIDPTIDGTVSDLSVKVGDSVEKGDFLFNIINDDLNVSVAKAVASYESAKNSLESAKIDAKEADENYDNAEEEDEEDDDAYTKDELRILKDKMDLAKNRVLQSQKSLSASAAEYRNTVAEAGKRKVTSSISGTVLEVNVKNGDDLGRTSSGSSTSETPIIIGDLETLKTEISVNEIDIANVSIGQKMEITLDALPEEKFLGKVEKIDSLGTTQSGVVSYSVTAGFDEMSGKIKPGMSVSAQIILEEKNNVLIIPSSAVKTGQNGDYVEILSQGIPRRKKIEIGISNDIQTEILSGIDEGDEVVTQTISSSSSSSASSSSSSNSSRSGSSSSRNQSGGFRLPGLGGGPR